VIHPIRQTVRALFIAVAALAAAPGLAQQTVPFRNNIPVAPQGIRPPPLPTAPVTFETAEGQTADNPFIGKTGYKPEVFTLGHRNSLGLALHPGTGEMWQNENGPNGGDKIDILRAGGNYGWPISSYGRTYPGPRQSDKPWESRFEQPVVFWVPSIAISGMTFYTGNKLPKWKGDVFVGALRVGEIPGTGHLERILFNEKMEKLRRESLLVPLRQRIRDVRQGPDELLYLLTDENDGAVLRIEPAE
jgi:glucose/arabinose dehydrogenase